MDNMENLEVIETSEKVEQTTEETPKMYTQAEVDAIVGKRVARTEAKIRKENDRKYGGLMEVLKAGTGKESVEEVKDTFQNYYASRGVKFPEKPVYSAKDIEVLAKAEANEFINAGFEDVVEEVDRLAGIGVEKMTAREKALFKVLAEHRQSAERSRELASLGASDDVINSQEFQTFARKFNPDTPIADVYDIYKLKHSIETPKTMGSMKSTAPDNGLKDYYSYEEASKFTKADFDKNPALFQRVQESMRKWK